MSRKEGKWTVNDRKIKEQTFAMKAGKNFQTHEQTHIYICTLWLLSPSRLAVVTKQVPSSRDVDRRMRSQGKVSSSFTKTTSPT